MTMASPLPPADRDAAAAWVARMDDPATWTAADEAALQAWLAADPRRHGLLLQVQAAWELPGTVTPPAEAEAVNGAPDDDAIEPAKDRGTWARRGVLGGLVAAGIAGAAATRLVLANGAQYVTRLGEIRRVPLDDGSVMTINSDTTLKVNLGRHAREVELDQGEAWFEVAKDAQRPFVVASGPVRAQAIGTAFSVRKREEGVEILVTEGVVETWSAAARGGGRARHGQRPRPGALPGERNRASRSRAGLAQRHDRSKRHHAARGCRRVQPLQPAADRDR